MARDIRKLRAAHEGICANGFNTLANSQLTELTAIRKSVIANGGSRIDHLDCGNRIAEQIPRHQTIGIVIHCTRTSD